MTGRKMTRLEGMLLGALVALTEFRADGRPAPKAVLAARELVEKVLKRQRKKDPKRTTGGRRRRLAPRGPALNANVHDHKFDDPFSEARREQELAHTDLSHDAIDRAGMGDC